MVFNDYIYDIETYPNIFTLAKVKNNGKEVEVFEISDRKNDVEGMLEFLREVKREKGRLVGFNNLGFDYPVIHFILQKSITANKFGKKLEITAEEIYAKAMATIGEARNNPYSVVVKDSDTLIKQVDLYKINHYDNKAKATSLKMLEFNMRLETIDDLPFPVGTYLNDNEKDVLVEYNKKDILATLRFYNYCYDMLELRAELTERFGFDCTNFNDTKIGKELFIRTLEEKEKGCCYTALKNGQRKINQTKRDHINLGECIFDYVKFERPEFKAILDWFKNKTITETKGSLSDLKEHELGDVAKYCDLQTKRKKITDPNDKYTPPSEDVLNDLRSQYPLGWLEEKELKSPKGAKSYYWCWKEVENLHVIINGFRFDFGTGGIHGAVTGVLRSTDERRIRSLDVASYYPNLAICNNAHPQHLGETFCNVYQYLYQLRKSEPKGSGANKALKLALNGTYGETNNKFSPLYDPKYTMAITINGQLSLCMLMEKMINLCDARIIMCNTDGYEYIIAKNKVKLADNIVKEWEALTGLQMEGVEYESMYIRDVNNYIAVKDTGVPFAPKCFDDIKGAIDSGVVKTKGAYEVLPFEKLGWHKNHSSMVVAMAAAYELLGAGTTQDMILNHTNKYDFMLRTKVNRSSELVMMKDGNETKLQNICRYYPSHNGGKLIKLMPPIVEGGDKRRLGIDTEWEVVACNNIKSFDWGDLNYDYYFTESRKLVDCLPFIEV